jgi:hypothetical protein
MFPFAYGRSMCSSKWNREAFPWKWVLKRVEEGKWNSRSQLLEINCLEYQEVWTKCCICRLGADNPFPPGQVLKEYCRTEAMADVAGVLSCTAVDKKQQNLLCRLSRYTGRSGLLDFQFESTVSDLGNKWLTEHNRYTVSPNTDVAYKDYSISLPDQGLVYRSGSGFKFP